MPWLLTTHTRLSEACLLVIKGWIVQDLGFGKGGLLKRGLFRKVHFLENLEIKEILENPSTVENKGESDHFLEILENLEIYRF